MSREIKFRAWDEKNKQFADYEDIEECLSCQNRDGWKSSDGMGCCFGINAVEILSDCIIEQYTGLKDKNGKEIYEGDIVFCKQCNENHVIEWSENAACFDSWQSDGSCCVWFGESSEEINYTVIGNIHENGDLLGGEE